MNHFISLYSAEKNLSCQDSFERTVFFIRNPQTSTFRLIGNNIMGYNTTSLLLDLASYLSYYRK